MCGIAGIILKKKSDLNLPEVALNLSRALKHRGPDGEGIICISPNQITPFKTDHSPTFKNTATNYIPKQELSFTFSNCSAAFAHRRLSIIDLSEAGHQPMCCKDAKIWITFNGEIYNYIELKEELKNKGYVFVSDSDTEVVINAYKHWGKNCVEKFNGMWAFCIYDSANQLYFASRDRLGVKPFYYLNNLSYLAFASEQKAFVKSKLIKADIDEKSLHHYLVNDVLEFDNANFFKEVNELWPGTNLSYSVVTNEFKIERYYNLRENINLINDSLSDEEITLRIKEKLENAVKLRLRSDVEVGSCLSGGIDSSALVGLMTEITKKPVYTFTSVYKQGAFNEEKFADSLSKKNNSKHFKTSPDLNSFEKDFETLVYALDAPIWDSST
ncbi:MAG: asparagine synthase (glutamine-hydrolyzing), partial [Bacteroidia bacterium]|nr:asparagine synthase (glutamine-hydrolyzing) [Bacteroidia bacterium]